MWGSVQLNDMLRAYSDSNPDLYNSKAFDVIHYADMIHLPNLLSLHLFSSG